MLGAAARSFGRALPRVGRKTRFARFSLTSLRAQHVLSKSLNNTRAADFGHHFRAGAVVWSISAAAAAATGLALLGGDIAGRSGPDRRASLYEARVTATQHDLQLFDSLYDSAAWQDLHDALTDAMAGSKAAANDPEYVWRLARAKYQLQQEGSDKSAGKTLVEEALRAVTTSVAAHPSHARLHVWLGILTNEAASLQGTKAKISKLLEVKAHWEKAVSLDPQDANALHLLGRWCLGIVEIGWWSRKIAAAVFGSIPGSSYEEALDFFERAESVQPGNWIMNQVLLAKCLIALGRKDEAATWLQASLGIRAKTTEDQEAHAQAQELLKSCPAKA